MGANSSSTTHEHEHEHEHAADDVPHFAKVAKRRTASREGSGSCPGKLIVITPPQTTRKARASSDETESLASSPASPQAVVRDRKTARPKLTREASMVLSSNAKVKEKSLAAILNTSDKRMDRVREELYEHLQSEHAGEGFEFLFAARMLSNTEPENTKVRDKAVIMMMERFVLPSAPREVCLRGDTRAGLLCAWSNQDMEQLAQLLTGKALKDVYSDMLQNSGFQHFVTMKLEEGLVAIRE